MPQERERIDRTSAAGAAERSLRESGLIRDCAVLDVMALDGRARLVAFVVPEAGTALAHEELARWAATELGADRAPDCYVPVRALPVTEAGEVDAVRLLELPVLDGDVIRRWEARIRELDGVTDAAVLAEDAVDAPPALHLSDLLPSYDGPREPVASAASPAGTQRAERTSSSRPAAFADGGAFTPPRGAPTTLTEALLRTASEHGSHGIRILRADGGETVITYADLLDAARRILGGLRRAGLRAGDAAVLQLPEPAEHFPVFWACLLGGIRPVTVAVPTAYDPRNAVAKKLLHAWRLLGRAPLLVATSLVEPLQTFARTMELEGLRTIAVEACRLDAPVLDHHASRPEDVAFFQLSSGSTGMSKCIQITHGGVIHHVHASQQFLGLSSEDVTLNWLPMDHVVPLLMYHTKDVCLGIEQVQVPGSVILGDPLKWLDAIERYRVTHTWSPNFGYKMVADALASAADRRWDLACVKSFVNAGEQVTLPVAREFLQRVAPFGVTPRAMQPAYGMAEVCTAMTYEADFDLETSARRVAKASLTGELRPASGDEESVTFIQCGPVIPGVQVRIADRANLTVPEGTIGRIQITGPVLTPGYLNNAEANGEAFVGDGWFNTGDLGFLWNGRLTITGREKELIIVNGANFYCYDIEDVAAGVPGVLPTFTAACGIDDAETGTESLALFFVLDETAGVDLVTVVRQIRSDVGAHVGLSPAVIVPVPREEFPKTTSGKIQRSQLKQWLSDGRFAGTLKDLDIRLENGRTLPDWFYRSTWRRRRWPEARAAASPGPRLVFSDGDGLGGELADRLRSQGHRVIVVETGNGFERAGTDRYRIDPNSPDDYRTLLGDVRENAGPVAQVWHLWTCDAPFHDALPEDGLNALLVRGPFSVLCLVQALASEQHGRSTTLFVTSTHAWHVADSDGVSPDRGTIPPLLRTAESEHPWLTCRHVDLGTEVADGRVEWLLRESEAPPIDREVAFRSGIRWVRRLERADLTRQPAEPPFERGAAILVTGGLGGVSREVVRHLLTQFHARVLLVGRTPLAPDEAAAAGHEERRAAKRAALEELRRLPGAVHYEAVDVADGRRMAEVVAEARSRWGRDLDAVLHLAGLYTEQPLIELSPADFEATLRPKVHGTVALHRLVADRPGTRFVTFSSVNGFFGGHDAGAYAAANGFLDTFVQYQRLTSDLRSSCIGWTIWDETGMSRGYAMTEAAQARGYRVITPRQGLLSLLVVLSRQEPHVLAGIVGTSRAIRSDVWAEQPGTERLVGYYTGAERREQPNWPQLGDKFGHRTTCVLQRVQELPRDASGAVDRRVLHAALHGGARTRVAPSGDVEKLVASVWQDVLKVDGLGVDDNFFELGGTSFLAGQIAGRLRDALNTEVGLTQVFQFPTIAAQAAHFAGQAEQSETAVASSQARGAARREAARRRQRVRA